jgi:colicin import membrane protein
METTADKARAIAWALLLHVAVVAIMYLGVLWSRPMQAPSVRGSVVEAVLVTSLPSAAQPARRQPRETAPPPQPAPEPRPQQAPTPPQPEAQAEPPRPDLVERERAARLAEQREAEERARREEQERRRQEQVLLEQQRQQEEAEQRERLRRQQEQQRKELEEIRRQREQAERERKLAEQRLEQIADQRRAAQAEREAPEQPPAEQLGNQGTDDSLLGRYVVAIQQAVERSWIRPETIRPGQPCEVRIVQIPGGEVISATVQPSCRYDELGKRSVEAAVLRAQPLPYTGYESVFRREIIFTFRAPEG